MRHSKLSDHTFKKETEREKRVSVKEKLKEKKSKLMKSNSIKKNNKTIRQKWRLLHDFVW